MKTTKLSEKFKIEHEGLYIIAEKLVSGRITIEPLNNSYDNNGFVFFNSRPETIKAIGEMLVEASSISDAMFKC
jgi:hypothetical protein